MYLELPCMTLTTPPGESPGKSQAGVGYEEQRRAAGATEGLPMTADLPEPEAVLDSPGTSCAYLTPLIKERLLPLASGQVLEVRSDDPASREGVPAWSRLTGNELIASVAEGKHKTRFFLRKK
jgi:TusA-related sulfurtransferase